MTNSPFVFPYISYRSREAVKISIEFNLSDLVLNSHDLTNSYTLDIAMRSLTQIVVRP